MVEELGRVGKGGWARGGVYGMRGGRASGKVLATGSKGGKRILEV